MSGKKDKRCNIKVVVRARPSSLREKKSDRVSNLICTDREVMVEQNLNRVLRNSRQPTSKKFTFDSVFDQSTSQRTIFTECITPVLNDVLQGFNCTVFAYGQTGTGKTYTMEGDTSSSELVGVIPRSLNFIFDRLSGPHIQSFIKVSFLELYNEELNDLLTDHEKPLRIYEQSKSSGGVLVHNLEQVAVNSATQALEILKKGIAKRTTAETNLNKHSSRSHCIFTMTIQMNETDESREQEIMKVGTLNLVDLAGSESIGRSGAIDVRAKEAGMINTSLLTLGRVISSLVDRVGYIPYRDSKLTRLLQESLGGKAKTVIIATISPFCNDETLGTLEYASRAKKIVNKPAVNQKVSQKKVIHDMFERITTLQRENMCLREKNGIFLPPERYAEMEAEIKARRQRTLDAEAELDDIHKEFASVKVLFGRTKDDLEDVQKRKREIERLLETTRIDLEETKKGMEELSFLVQTHLKNEKVLHKQANVLKDTLEETIDDNSELYRKIDRVKSDSVHNKDATQIFKREATATLHSIVEDISGLKSSTEECSNKHRTKIEYLVTGESDRIELLKSGLEEFRVECLSQEGIISTKTDEFVQQTLARLNQHQKCLEEDQKELTQFTSNMFTAQQIEFDGMLKKIAAQKELIDSNQRYMADRMDLVTQGVCSILKTHLKSLGEMGHKVESSSKAQMENATKYTTLVGQMMQQQQSQLNGFFDTQNKMIREQQARMSELTQAQNTLLANATNSQQTFQKTSEEHASTSKSVCLDIKKSTKHLSAWHEEYKLNSKQTMEEHDVKCQSQTSLISEVSTSIKNCKQNLESNVSSFVDKQKLQTKSRTDQTNCDLKSCSEFNDTRKTCLESLSKTRARLVAQQQPNLQQAQDAVKSFQDQTMSHEQFRNQEIQHFSTLQSEKLDNILTQASSLADNYKDTPRTNRTPKKREFNYPRKLVRTKPHPELLSNFRKKPKSTDSPMTVAAKCVDRMNIGSDMSSNDSEQVEGEGEGDVTPATSTPLETPIKNNFPSAESSSYSTPKAAPGGSGHPGTGSSSALRPTSSNKTPSPASPQSIQSEDSFLNGKTKMQSRKKSQIPKSSQKENISRPSATPVRGLVGSKRRTRPQNIKEPKSKRPSWRRSKG